MYSIVVKKSLTPPIIKISVKVLNWMKKATYMTRPFCEVEFENVFVTF